MRQKLIAFASNPVVAERFNSCARIALFTALIILLVWGVMQS